MAGDENAVAWLRRLESRRYAAMEAADVGTLAELLAADLRYTHSDASTDDRETYLARVADGTFDYGPIEHHVSTVTVVGDVALCFGEMHTIARVRGTPKDIHNAGLAVWVADDGVWRLRAYQPTAIPQRREAG